MCGASSTTIRSSSANNHGSAQDDPLKLRDHYREIAEEITRSLTESLQVTIAAAQVAETERTIELGTSAAIG